VPGWTRIQGIYKRPSLGVIPPKRPYVPLAIVALSLGLDLHTGDNGECVREGAFRYYQQVEQSGLKAGEEAIGRWEPMCRDYLNGRGFKDMCRLVGIRGCERGLMALENNWKTRLMMWMISVVIRR
jgi:hypothetical protein